MANTAIRALKTFSDGVISMYEGEIRSIDSTKASAFISAGLATNNTTSVLPSGSTTITANGTPTNGGIFGKLIVSVQKIN